MFRITAMIVLLLAAPIACYDPTTGPINPASALTITDGVSLLDTLHLTVGASVQLTAVSQFGVQALAIWSSTDSQIASVTTEGLASGVAPGTAAISVSLSNYLSGSVPVVVVN